MNKLPVEFVERMKTQLADDFSDFEKSLAEIAPTSIRLNSQKTTSEFNDLEKVAWHSEGRYLPERPIFTLDPAFHAGSYYVQEASSMFLKEIFTQKIDTKQPLRVLDLCASPGGKSTLIADLLNSESVLVANEVIKSRVGALKENLMKWGFPNYIVSSQDSEEMIELEGFFDVVLVDAPCSGEGLFRKDANAANEWSEENVRICSARQKRILRAAALLVAERGILIYSTCTYNAAENDENVKWIANSTELVVEKLENLPNEGIVSTEVGYQFYPHKTQGEGFYISVLRQKYSEEQFIKAKVRLNKLPKKYWNYLEPFIENTNDFEYFLKPEGTVIAIHTSLLDAYGTLLRALEKRSVGLEIGIFKGTDFIPIYECKQ